MRRGGDVHHRPRLVKHAIDSVINRRGEDQRVSLALLLSRRAELARRRICSPRRKSSVVSMLVSESWGGARERVTKLVRPLDAVVDRGADFSLGEGRGEEGACGRESNQAGEEHHMQGVGRRAGVGERVLVVWCAGAERMKPEGKESN